MTDSIGDEVFARMDALSQAEKKVARTLLADYPSAGLASAASLAKAAGTSTPTVLRLLARLGLGSYPEFQERLRREVSHSRNSPVSRAERSIGEGSAATFEPEVLVRTEVVGSVLTTVPPGEFEAAVAAIVRSRRLVLFGGYFSRYIARIAGAQLDQLVPGVVVADEPLGRDAGLFMSLDKDSVVIVIDMRRYELSSRKVAENARKQGAKVIVITDEDLSPATEEAHVVLPVRVDAVPFDTFVALLTLVEAIVGAVFHQLGEPALARMRQWEHSVQISRTGRDA